MDLDGLIARRELVRANEKELTAKIKKARESIPPKENKLAISQEFNRKLIDENKILRKLLCLSLRSEEKTYKFIGDKLGISGSRARGITENFIHWNLDRFIKDFDERK